MQTTDVREAAKSAVDQSKSFLSKQLDDRSTVIGQQIGSVAKDLRNAGDQLRQSGVVGGAAGYVDQGADAIDKVAQYLQNADGDALIADLEDLARKQPWLIAAGALFVGFAASRFLKTSSSRRYYGSSGDGGSSGTYGGYGGGSSATSSGGVSTTGDLTGVRSGGGRYAS